MGEICAGEEYPMSSVHTEYKAISLGEISETECRQKMSLNPVDVGEMRRINSEKGRTKGM